MTEVEHDSTLTDLAPQNNVVDLDEVQGEWELDDLVNDLHKECNSNEGKKKEVVIPHQPFTQLVERKEARSYFFEENLSPILELVSTLKNGADNSSGENHSNKEVRALDKVNPRPWSM